MGLRERVSLDLANRVLAFKRTIKQWFYYAGLKYLQTHKLSDVEETVLENITDYLVESIDKMEEDEEFLRKIKLTPVKLPEKKIKN